MAKAQEGPANGGRVLYPGWRFWEKGVRGKTKDSGYSFPPDTEQRSRSSRHLTVCGETVDRATIEQLLDGCKTLRAKAARADLAEQANTDVLVAAPAATPGHSGLISQIVVHYLLRDKRNPIVALLAGGEDDGAGQMELKER